MRSKVGTVAVCATVMLLVLEFIFCLTVMNSHPEQQTDMILMSSIFASVMTLVVIIYACMTLFDKPSDEYRKRFPEMKDAKR